MYLVSLTANRPHRTNFEAERPEALLTYTKAPGSCEIHERRAMPVTQQLTPEVMPGQSGRYGTSQILSPIMEIDKQATPGYGVYEWPLYIQLSSNEDTGDQVGAYVREFSSGANWAAGFHVESFGGGAGGTKIGYNAEMHRYGPERSIGVNIQTKNDAPAHPASFGDQAINIQSDAGVGWASGVQFDNAVVKQGINFTPKSSGERAIWIQGHYSVGLDAGKNPIRVSAGTPIQLDEAGQITVAYNPTTRQIEFKNGADLLFAIPTTKKQ